MSSTPPMLDSLSRRDWLQSAAVAVTGLAASGGSLSASEAGLRSALAAKELIPVGTTGRAASISPRKLLLIVLTGGASQVDLFDPKPAAPVEGRSPFAPIRTSVPDIFLSELLPGLAARMQQVALVRTVQHPAARSHEAGLQLALTGQLATFEQNPLHWSQALTLLSQGSSSAREFRAMELPAHRSAVTSGITRGKTVARGRSAAQLVTAQLVTIEQKQHYGDSEFGRRCAAAVQALRQGADLCTVHFRSSVFDQLSFDMHANGARLPTTLDDYRTRIAPEFDRAFSALLDELPQHDSLAETVVAVVSEMGRTPDFNARGGRDHWSGAWTQLLAGPTIAGGTVIGRTDARGAEPIERPVTPAEFAATWLSAAGIDCPRERMIEVAGMRWPLVTAAPITELLAGRSAAVSGHRAEAV